MGRKEVIDKNENKFKKTNLRYLTRRIIYCIILNVANNGEVAQLARASGSYPAGQEFESPLRHQKCFLTFFCFFYINKTSVFQNSYTLVFYFYNIFNFI